MTEKGKVREVNGNCVIIIPDRSAACFGCMNNMECKSRGEPSLTHVRSVEYTGGGFLTAENPLGLPIEIGQIVEVGTEAGSLVHQALTAFLPPTLSFLIGFILTRFLFPQAGEAAAFIGLALLFGAAFVVCKIRKKHPPERGYTVTRILG